MGKAQSLNKTKSYRLNTAMEKYFCLVKSYLSTGITSGSVLHEMMYDDVKNDFNLNTNLINTARSKAVEILKSYNKTGNVKNKKKRQNKKLRVRKTSIRFNSRAFKFSKTNNILTPYWVTLSLTGVMAERINIPISLGKKQTDKLEKKLNNGWYVKSIDMVKKNSEWYVHLILEKWIKFEEPKDINTVIGIDLGEKNFATAISINVDKDDKGNLKSIGKPVKGQFWRGEEIKRIRGKYSHIRRSLGRKKIPKKIKEIGQKEKRKVNQEIHKIANEIIDYAKQSESPIIVLEDLTNIRDGFHATKRLNRRFHSLPFYKLKTYIEYKANSAGIDVRYIPASDTTKTCHICGNVSPYKIQKREYTCLECGMVYNRDLNSAVNIANRYIELVNI